MRTLTSILAVAATLALGASDVAAAEDGSLAGLHAQKREGSRMCMSEHSHHGASSGQTTKKLAEAAAIRSWADFTAFEYGASWGNYAVAASKDMKCSQSGSEWGCELNARPCKEGEVAATGRRRIGPRG